MNAAPAGLGRLRLLASAIAGRSIDVAAAEAGERAWTDGATIFVDADLSRRDQLNCAAVQAALLGAGSYEPEVVRTLARRPAFARRYLAIEGHRALGAHEHLLPSWVHALVDADIAALADSPTASLEVAKGQQVLPAPPEVFGTIHARRVRFAPADAEPASHAAHRGRDAVLAELDDNAGDDEGLSLDLISSPVGGGGAIGRMLKRLFGDARSQGSGSPGADAPTHRTRASTQISRTSALTTSGAPTFEDADLVARQSRTYPEWDVFGRRYRFDWCTVVEMPPPEGATEIVPVGVHALRRSLARLGMELERHHRQMQGDDIDIDATVEALVQGAAGSPPDEAVYVDSVRRRRDLSVLVLLDVSGSAGQPAATSGCVHDHQRAAAAALTAALHALGDRVALYAFRSQGRSAVELFPVKRFGDPLDARVRRRLGSLVPGAYTRLGAGIRHGTAVLEEEGGTARRLLVVLSDGFAYDHGYEGAYGEADARRALAEARRRGVACLCLSVAAGTDAEALRRVFGTAAHARIPTVDQLPALVGPLFRSALRSAEVQRRAWQRSERTRERLHIERRRTA